MATPGTLPIEKSRQIEFYKVIRKEYRDRYESMRSLEWKVLFQAYAGYAAIAVAFWHLQSPLSNLPLWLVAMIVTLLFFVATQYLCFRIQERLIAFGVTYENYTDALCALMKGDNQELLGPGTSRLGHQFFWTYEIQLGLAFLTFTGLLGYEEILGWHNPPKWIYLLAVWSFVSLIGGIFAYRARGMVKIIYYETVAQYRPAVSRQLTIWKNYKQKKSGTPATGQT